MLIIMISRSGLKLGHVGSKTRSLGQILEKPFVHSRGHSFVLHVMTLVRMLIILMSRSSLKLGHVVSKTRSVGQQATQVSDLGPLWPSCLTIFLVFFPQCFMCKAIIPWSFDVLQRETFSFLPVCFSGHYGLWMGAKVLFRT